MKVNPYNRAAAVAYARKWALGHNPEFYNFDKLGGDCTNFASQTIYAGGGVMNFTPTFGWFYVSSSRRTPSWTGVEYLRNFLVANTQTGPFAAEVGVELIQPGDIIQLGNDEGFYHSPVVTSVENGRILVAAHTFAALDRPLNSYDFRRMRCLHILGVRSD